MSTRRSIENTFEAALFNSRLIVILAVVGSLVSSIVMFVHGVLVIFRSTVDFVRHPLQGTDVHQPIQGTDEGGEALSIAMISSVDNFLFATVLLIFALGIYELFVSKIDPASRNPDSRPNWLAIHSLDDLKGSVGKVILMILIVRVFESAVKMEYKEPIHLLWLAACVMFVAAALYLQHLGHAKPHHAQRAASASPEHGAEH